MGAGQYNFSIEQGATFDRRITWKDDQDKPITLEGYSARMQIRLTHSSSEKLISLSSAPGGGITLGGSAGTIDILISALATALLDFDMAVYDLELISSGGEVTRLLEGTVTLSKEVTR